ncbi:major facilitator superfamily domain-containing protein [Zychaea mexicana]|uniref:major facilitator superfamily domain-containing protein n=1 Tax=Zychaea mexicana TaxID=64656 RepID=UPI0022FE8A90|nr:major facilitator superfamily domain-containing protein [Zychaea mexicana]KAI9490585.1 major facilitator superfamily domain-containing protein [Zychaea mexicana]
MPAIQDLQEYFGTTLTVMNATIALYVAAMALAPLIWSPLSERVGRRYFINIAIKLFIWMHYIHVYSPQKFLIPVYLISMLIYTVTTIVCGVSKNLALFFVMRTLQGVSSSAGMTVGGGTIADLFLPHERGKAMSLLTLGTVTGPAVGPLVGGYVSKYLGWRWIFYICTIIGGVVLLLNALIVRESLYQPDRVKPETMKERIAYLKFDPLRGLMLLLRPHVILTCLPLSVSFGWFYFLVAILSPTYTEIYNFDQGSMGLLYLTGERLLPVLCCVPFIVAGALMYGWFVHAKLHWFVPLVGYLIMSLGTMYGNVTSNSYLVESYLPVAASGNVNW